MAINQVISTLDDRGADLMGPGVVLHRHPDARVINGALLTVESNHFAVLKSRGAILNVYETGQHVVSTPDRAILGSFTTAFFGGQSPWQYEVMYVNRSKMVVKATGKALSLEMGELSYEVDYYFHVASTSGAVALVTHMPIDGHRILADQVNTYATPVVEQAINQVVQVTPFERVNEKIHEISEMVQGKLAEFLTVFGITLDTVKVLVRPSDPQMRALMGLRAFGLSELDAVRYHTAMMMASKGIVSAPNMAIGQPFHVGGVPNIQVGGMLHPSVPAEPAAPEETS